MHSSIQVYLSCPQKGQQRKGNNAGDELDHLPTWMHETTVLFDQAAYAHKHIPDGRQPDGYVREANVEHRLGHRPVERYSSIQCTGGLHGHEGWPREYRPFTSQIPWDGNGAPADPPADPPADSNYANDVWTILHEKQIVRWARSISAPASQARSLLALLVQKHKY
jgi:hypothetical protein